MQYFVCASLCKYACACVCGVQAPLCTCAQIFHCCVKLTGELERTVLEGAGRERSNNHLVGSLAVCFAGVCSNCLINISSSDCLCCCCCVVVLLPR